ncbi:pitrilysin family protein [Pararhodobacter sp.]|uniref:M16 family metallopeptidase n=1 Tax=Pararhodobacter sp. TaxID=2127056 RepID=UPI002AFEA7D7|nr:pitrilysin family protein [Pararhodobacter sp.]
MMRLIYTVALALVLATPVASRALAIDIQAVTSPNGHDAWLVEEHSIPFVSIEMIFTGGASIEPEGQDGVISLMTSLLTEGAGDLDSLGYASALEALAGSVSFSAGRDQVSLSIRALSENRDQVIDLAILALTQATFDADSLERVRAQTIASLERAARNPDTIAGQAFAALGYAGHPYARPSDGTPDTIAALTRDNVLDAHRAAFTSDLTYIAAAGDITAAELGEIVDRLYADLPPASVPLPEYRSFSADPGVTVIDHPSPQSVIQFGHGGIHWDDDDFMAAYIMNTIFGGGGFGSRLMEEIREARGLTYGIYTSLASNRFGDSYVGQFSTANETAAEAIALVREQFDWLANGGITQEDLERVQTYLTGAYPLRFDGNESIANILASMQFQSFPLNYVNIRNDLVRAVTLEDIQRVATRLAQPEALHFVVVGQPVGLD